MRNCKQAYIKRFTFMLRGVLCIFVTKSRSYWSQTQRPDSFIALWDYLLAEMQAYRHGYPTLDPEDCWRANAWPLKEAQHGELCSQEPTRISAKTSMAFDVRSDIASGDTRTHSANRDSSSDSAKWCQVWINRDLQIKFLHETKSTSFSSKRVD